MKTTDHEFERLRDYMYDKFGINLAQKRVLIEGRLSSMLMQRGYKDFDSYIDDVMADKTGQEVSLLVSKLTTNFTYFLREEGHYTFLKENVLKPLRDSGASKTLNIWSAASSSGEEPYSIALVTTDYFAPLKNVRISIRASDISEHVLSMAREGAYSADRLSPLPKNWLPLYFKKREDGAYVVNDAIKRMVNYQYFNLNDSINWVTGAYDVIFCRNVMIYFDKPTRDALVKKLYKALVPGGYLFIGMSESLINLETDFVYIKPSIYQKPSENGVQRNANIRRINP